MSDKKISQLPELFVGDSSNDILPFTDSDASITNKIKLKNLPLNSAELEERIPQSFFGTGSLPEHTTNITSSDVTLSDTYVYIGSAVTGIASQAFDGSSLTSVTIPENVTGIGSNAFSNSSSLNDIKFLSLTPPTIGTTIFDGVGATQIRVPVGATSYGETFAGLTVVYGLY